jgi:5'-nucleotidase
MSEEPLILLTNDDGISAAGITALEKSLSDVAEVIVVAPHQEQSAVGHGISLSRPMRIEELVVGRRYAVTGSPADAVLVGLYHLCPRRPALVVSGINHGLNLGTDVFYSGTVAGALEGVIHGVPGLAVSQEVREEARVPLDELLRRTASFAALVADRLLSDPPPEGLAVSINAPAAQASRYTWTRLGRRVYRERVERRLDLRGLPYYWVGGPVVRDQSPEGTDSYALERGLISLTPLCLNLTGSVPSCYHAWVLDGYGA